MNELPSSGENKHIFPPKPQQRELTLAYFRDTFGQGSLGEALFLENEPLLRGRFRPDSVFDQPYNLVHRIGRRTPAIPELTRQGIITAVAALSLSPADIAGLSQAELTREYLANFVHGLSTLPHARMQYATNQIPISRIRIVPPSREHEFIEAMEGILSVISDQEAEDLIRWRFGLNDGITRTTEELEIISGIKVRRIRNMLGDSLGRLRIRAQDQLRRYQILPPMSIARTTFGAVFVYELPYQRDFFEDKRLEDLQIPPTLYEKVKKVLRTQDRISNIVLFDFKAYGITRDELGILGQAIGQLNPDLGQRIHSFDNFDNEIDFDEND